MELRESPVRASERSRQEVRNVFRPLQRFVSLFGAPNSMDKNALVRLIYLWICWNVS